MCSADDLRHEMIHKNMVTDLVNMIINDQGRNEATMVLSGFVRHSMSVVCRVIALFCWSFSEVTAEKHSWPCQRLTTRQPLSVSWSATYGVRLQFQSSLPTVNTSKVSYLIYADLLCSEDDMRGKMIKQNVVALLVTMINQEKLEASRALYEFVRHGRSICSFVGSFCWSLYEMTGGRRSWVGATSSQPLSASWCWTHGAILLF